MKNIFTEHPHSIGESYWQHFYHAARFGSSMVLGGVACCIHAVFPCFFKKTGSNYLLQMTHEFIYRMPTVDDRIFMFVESVNRKVREKSSHDSRRARVAADVST